jgi:hypothetical protein
VHVLQGHSKAADGTACVAEAVEGWTATPEVIFAFTSTGRDAGAVARALHLRFPQSVIVGCTTAGEFVGGTHHNGSLVVTGLVDSGIRWAAELVPAAATITPDRALATVDELYARLGLSRATVAPEHAVALLFVDGLCRAEEHIAAALADALEGVPLAGGSAGDDLAFERTEVICGATAQSAAAVLVVGAIDTAEVQILKHQHFRSSRNLLAITAADPSQRRVYEIDGYPALEAYARALGLSTDAVTDVVMFNHPVTFHLEGTPYVRSIQQIHDDGSLAFYCAVEAGMVVSIAEHSDMVGALDAALSDAEPFDFILNFNCILRSLEAAQSDLHPPLGLVYDRATHALAGFDTYGEQLHGVHMNQTLVAVAMRGAR